MDNHRQSATMVVMEYSILIRDLKLIEIIYRELLVKLLFASILSTSWAFCISSPVWQVHPSVAEGCQPQRPPAAGAATCRHLGFDASLALAKRTQLEMSKATRKRAFVEMGEEYQEDQGGV